MIDIEGWATVVILTIGLVASMIGALFSIRQMKSEYKRGKPCLTFDQFIRFYEICPDKFGLYDDCVMVETVKRTYGPDNRDCFYFKTAKDFRKYQKWKIKKEAWEQTQRLTKESTEATQRLITMLQAEIDKHSEEANSEINGALDKQQEILNRMMGG